MSLASMRQHVFLTGRFSQTDLLLALNDWTLALRDKKSVIVAYILTFQLRLIQSSSTMRKILCKLQADDVSDNLISRIQSLLSNRTLVCCSVYCSLIICVSLVIKRTVNANCIPMIDDVT